MKNTRTGKTDTMHYTNVCRYVELLLMKKDTVSKKYQKCDITKILRIITLNCPECQMDGSCDTVQLTSPEQSYCSSTPPKLAADVRQNKHQLQFDADQFEK